MEDTRTETMNHSFTKRKVGTAPMTIILVQLSDVPQATVTLEQYEKF